MLLKNLSTIISIVLLLLTVIWFIKQEEIQQDIQNVKSKLKDFGLKLKKLPKNIRRKYITFNNKYKYRNKTLIYCANKALWIAVLIALLRIDFIAFSMAFLIIAKVYWDEFKSVPIYKTIPKNPTDQILVKHYLYRLGMFQQSAIGMYLVPLVVYVVALILYYLAITNINTLVIVTFFKELIS